MKAVAKTEVGFDNMVYKEVEEPKAERDLVKIKIKIIGKEKVPQEEVLFVLNQIH